MRLIFTLIFLINISYAQELLRENIGTGGASEKIGTTHINQYTFYNCYLLINGYLIDD